MAAARRIGILTGGGDVPGLNSVIKSVVYQTTGMGYEVLGIRRGWEGLTHLAPGAELDANYVRPLDRANTRGIDRTGGTVLHTSRVNPLRVRRPAAPAHLTPERLRTLEVAEGTYDLMPVVLENVTHLGLDCLIVIGGDDTLSFAKALDEKGLKVIGIPKTMDNDVQGTEYCIGFSTAITRAKELITRQRTTLGSHERIGIFRIFGRDAGFTALYTAYVTSGRCVIPEVEFDLDSVIEILLEDKGNNPSRYAFLIASEGAVWKGQALAEYGEADALDQIVAITFANVAVDLIREGIHGRLVAVQDGKYAHAPLPDPKLGPRKVDVPSLYNLTRFRPHYAGRIGTPLMLSQIRC